MTSYASIPVVVSIVMVTMMVPVPPLPFVPPIFVRVVVITVAIPAIVIRSVLWVPRPDVNAKPIICFRLGGCQGNQSERRQPQEKISFHILFSLVRRKRNRFHATLRFESGSSLMPAGLSALQSPQQPAVHLAGSRQTSSRLK